ncbi:NUDIX domain-containing protein [Metabacillus herbersteinensis]|uniref:NUDIX domain-containing protein n=1 Tax=Metabacillus herbersteinensis TaxID=283816 RepID=A0ABV6GCJ5_9BACI
METKKRGNVWLAVSGLVENERGEWLVVKKKYGGLKGMWSFPAGFVEEGETVDEAVLREIKEETGIDATVEGIIGIRSGVIKDVISDNMLIFKLQATSSSITIQIKELFEADFIHPSKLKEDPHSSLLLANFAEKSVTTILNKHDLFNPGDQFGYRSYTLFL